MPRLAARAAAETKAIDVSSEETKATDGQPKSTSAVPVAAKPPAEVRLVPQDLTAKELEGMLGELVEAYRSSAFQGKLRQVHEAVVKAKGQVPLLSVMGPVVLQVQAPILEKYGLPASSQGVELMKHAVGRRVAEGAEKVEELANQARQALGIEAMPDRHASAEEVLARKVDETERKLGGATPEAAAELQKQCRQRIASEREAGTLPESSAQLLESFLEDVASPDRAASAPSVLSLMKMSKFGICVDGLWVGDVPPECPVLDAPTQADFFAQHVLPNRPAVIRNAVDAARFPPMRDFADINYLRRRCGHHRVFVKSLGYEDQVGRPVFVSDPELKLPFAAFLDSVEAYEQALASGSEKPPVPFYLGKVPLNTELPELADDIALAATDPGRLYGKSFGPMIPQGIFTYFGCGRNTTAVHFDAHENILVCINGTKRLFLYPPADARYLYPCNDFTRSAVVPFCRTTEEFPEGVRKKYMLVPRARPVEVFLKAGDILYLPSCWWHCVEGSEDRNMILNWWFDLHPDKRALTTKAQSTSTAAIAA